MRGNGPINLAISIGDPAGIGTEVLIKALQQPLDGADVTVFGHQRLFQSQIDALQCSWPAHLQLEALAPGLPWQDVEWGVQNEAAGRIQVASLGAAVAAVKAGHADALCTAPITKSAAALAGFPFPGHTEYLAHAFGVAEFGMMLAGPTLRVVPLTGHVPLGRVAQQLSIEGVRRGLTLCSRTLADYFGIAAPRIALLGLNPHAGDSGLLGTEENDILVPAIRQFKDASPGTTVVGPLPADGFFADAFSWLSDGAPFDGVVCCYHDQALIPLKMVERHQAVNITMGLPKVRTSPAHGSALDIAGKNVADASSMRAALETAVRLARRCR